MDSSKNTKGIRYSDVVGVSITDENGNSSFIPYNAAKNSGLVSSGQDLATMQSPRYAFKDFSGAYSNDPANAALSASIVMDDNGKITVTIPEEWQDDEEIKKYTDSYLIDTLSKNYKSDKNVKYQDPYDETKQVTTEEYLKELNDALKFKVTALAATNPTKAEVVSKYGGTDAKNSAINSMTVDDIIIMSAKFDEDDSWVPMPAYMLLAYPELKNLESYTNGWVQKKDFLDNLYNIESGKITEDDAYGIATTPEKMLSEIEDMSPEEIAKTIAFGNFISQVDPKRSNWQQFLQAGDASSRGFYGGFYDWFVETSDLITNIANFSWINGNTVETRDFWNGFLGSSEEDFDATAYMGKSMQDMAYTNKDALSKAQAGYVQGRIAGQLVDTVVSLIAVGEASKALSNAITSKVTGKGAEAMALTMSEATNTSTATNITTSAKAQASALANQIANYETLKTAATGSANYQRFFTQTLGEAIDLYSNALNGTALTLGAMDTVQFAKIVNSAARIATTANFANTAVNVLGTMVIAAVVSNKELTTKVLSSKATDSETKTWIQQVMWDSAKITALSYATNLAVGALGKAIEGTKAEQVLKAAKQKASQKVTSFTEKIEHPWLSFIKWYANNRAAASKVSNAGATRAEAIKEAVLANEARAYGANLSTEPGSYGMKIVQEALAESGVQPGVTMSETLDNLAKAGVVLDPANLNLSEYEAWQADYVGLRNALTNWDDVQTAVSQVVHEFTNPDIYPTISQQMSEINKANGELLEVEQAEGLLSKAEIKKNKGYLKQDEGYIYAMHSPELSRYIVRGYELKVVANEGRMLGHENLNEYEPYKEALARFQKASEPLSERLRKIADEQYVPALAKAESNILDVMVDAGVYPRAFVEAMRASGKFGVNGQDWLRLVARKKTPEGAYTPFSRMVKEDNTISINKFRILDDEDITWPGNGLQELIEEYGITRAEKELVKEGKNATGKTSEIVVSGEKTRSAGLIKEYRNDFLKSVKQGINSFVQTVGQTVAVGKKRSAEQIEFVNDIATTGGIATIDIDALRSIMRDKDVPMADSIVDQKTLDKFLEESSDETKKVLFDVVGEKIEGRIDEYGVKVKKVPIGEYEAELDYTIADRISELNKAGYRTYNSHSGIAADHLSDSKAGGGYIQFDASLGKDKISKIKKAASKAGMDVTEDPNNPLYGNTISVYQTNAADGTPHSVIVNEANQLTYKKFKVPKVEVDSGNGWGWIWDSLDTKKFSAATDYREKQIEKLVKKHGGYAQSDDAARSESWNKFFESLGIENTAENQLVENDILGTLKNEQYNKLSELKENSPKDYEALLEKADRANAVENDAVRQSDEVQVAADEYRNSIKNFENQVIFNQKFSYIIRTTAETNTFKAFASENNIELGDGNGSAKSKLKSALWNKVINNEDLPEIKGLKKSKVKNIRELISALGGVENKAAEGVAIDDLVKQFKKEFYSMLDETPLFQNAGGPNPLKYELDEEKLYTDIEDAIGNMMERVRMDAKANAAIDGIVMSQGFKMSTPRFEFTVLSEILSKDVQKDLTPIIKDLARKIVNSSIPKNDVVIKGNIDSLYKKVEEAIQDKLESRFATAKTALESMGETAESKTVTELLEKHNADIKGAEEDPLVIKTMDSDGEIQYERVSPALASIYNERPTYSPMSTPMKVLNNLAILKKINTTDLSPRSFAKQSVSDPAMAFATVGGLPGTLHAIRDEIAYHFGPDLLRALEKSDPIRFENIKAISERENISMEEAFKRNSEALAKARVPFTLLNNELLRQANISKFGNEGALKVSRKNLNEKINGALRRTSDLLGTPQNKRETYVRLYAGEKAYLEALRKGYNQDQAEMFREHALNTATTNFRTKHAVFNTLRSTVPYLTSGLSGAKSFWQMFELDPIGVTSRIVTGFMVPIIYFAGEIFSDENLRKKYEALAESEKENHIVIAIGGELILIPVGEEIGKYANVVTHAVEILYNENKYSFWSLMLNDLVSFIPGVDLTGFTDPEILEPLAEESPSFLDVMDNGIAKVLAGVAPPIAQSMILGFTGRDLYTGRKIDTSYITIDEEGNPVIMSSSTSEFAKALAQVVGGDAKVIERAVSGTVGTVGIHVLDTITSAVQFVGSGGEDGSLTTAIDKTLADLSSPFSAKYYSGLERRFNYAVSNLYRRKEEIEKDEKYIKYNQEISNEKDSKKRQNLINKRNELLSDFMRKVEALIKGYKTAGGSLDKWKLSKVTSLITFEDAVRADRQFMDLNTNYQDARKQAMQTLYDMGITNPDGPSSLGYIYTDNDGKPQLKMWTPVQMQIIQNSFYEQGNVHTARIKAIIDDGSEDSLYNQKKLESEAEQPYWDKYNSTGKLSNDEWDAIDDLRKVYNAKVVLGLQGYMDTYGAAAVLNNDAVIDYLNDIIKVPSSYEKVKGRYVSSDNGKLNKQTGFAESYIKTIFGVK